MPWENGKWAILGSPLITSPSQMPSDYDSFITFDIIYSGCDLDLVEPTLLAYQFGRTLQIRRLWRYTLTRLSGHVRRLVQMEVSYTDVVGSRPP